MLRSKGTLRNEGGGEKQNGGPWQIKHTASLKTQRGGWKEPRTNRATLRHPVMRQTQTGGHVTTGPQPRWSPRGSCGSHSEASATSATVTSMMKKGGGQLVALLRNSLHASRSSRLLSTLLPSAPVVIFLFNSSLCSKRKQNVRSKHCAAWNWAKPCLSHQSGGCLNANVMSCCVSLGTNHSHVLVNLGTKLKTHRAKEGIGAWTLISEFWPNVGLWL